jgi:hypothetical protein
MQLAFPAPASSRWKNYTRFQAKGRPVPVKKSRQNQKPRQLPGVTGVTEVPPKMPFTGLRTRGWSIDFLYRSNSLKGNRRSALRSGMERVKGFLGAVPQIERNSRAPPRPTPQTEIMVARLTFRAPLTMIRNELL